VRFVGHIGFSAVALWPFAVRPSLRSAKPLIQILRSTIMIVTTGFNFISLRYLQLDQTVTTFFLDLCWSHCLRVRCCMNGLVGIALWRSSPAFPARCS
jgi:hypothetical protein